MMNCRGLTLSTGAFDNFGTTKPWFCPSNVKKMTVFTFVPSGVESVSAFFNRDLIITAALWACEVMCGFVGN